MVGCRDLGRGGWRAWRCWRAWQASSKMLAQRSLQPGRLLSRQAQQVGPIHLMSMPLCKPTVVQVAASSSICTLWVHIFCIVCDHALRWYTFGFCLVRREAILCKELRCCYVVDRRWDVAATAQLAAAVQELGIAHCWRCRQGPAAAALHTLRGRRAQVRNLAVVICLPAQSTESWSATLTLCACTTRIGTIARNLPGLALPAMGSSM